MTLGELAREERFALARRFRFAPTPSRELHVGSALAALFGWAVARATPGARFLLRIEDIDRARCKPAYEAVLMQDLAWLGLDWDEPPVRQSERTHLYDAALATLCARDAAYVCTCSRADVRAAQSAPHLGAPSDVYPGTCRASGRAAIAPEQRSAGGIRFDVERLGEGAVVRWTDEILGVQSIDDVRLTAGDTLLGRPGAPTYQLAVVVDDLAMGITDIVRGRDLLGSTARQILLQRALGALGANTQPTPRFHHHPLILDADGRKLSKRDGDLALASLRTTGLDPARLRAALGRAIGLFGANVQRASMADWIDATRTTPGSALHDGTWAAFTPDVPGL